MITFKCHQCSHQTERSAKNFHPERGDYPRFCTRKCMNIFKGKLIASVCVNCNKNVLKEKSKLSPNIFCSNSCSASYNNRFKRKSRRSRCEQLLCEMITASFPLLHLITNDKTALNGYEVDIYIPSLRLAIEWNGIVHFQPLYGEDKLETIQRRDSEKVQLAAANKINLIVIPDLVSTEKYVKRAFNDIIPIIQRLQGESNS